MDEPEQPRSKWSAVASIVGDMLGALVRDPVGLITLVVMIGVIYLAAIGREIPLMRPPVIGLLIGALLVQAMRRK